MSFFTIGIVVLFQVITFEHVLVPYVPSEFN
jgi:hypothetical protein